MSEQEMLESQLRERIDVINIKVIASSNTFFSKNFMRELQDKFDLRELFELWYQIIVHNDINYRELNIIPFEAWLKYSYPADKEFWNDWI